MIENEKRIAELRKAAIATMVDLSSKVLYYDRKEDEDLPRGVIEALVIYQHLTKDDLIDAFVAEFTKDIEASVADVRETIQKVGYVRPWMRSRA